MEGRMENSYLLEMPPLVIEKILSNVLNLSNVSQTCKYLYDAVCQMEKRKRVACIIRIVKLDGGFKRLTIDDDVVFDSVMNSHRTITNIQLDAGYRVKLNERQLERLTEIMEHFGANITSLVVRGVTLAIDKIIELLNQTSKLESLEFEHGRAFSRATGSLNLTSLKKLSIIEYPGLLEIVDSLPSGSLNDFRCSFGRKQVRQPKILQTLLSKQHNLKSLQIDANTDLAVLRVNHLQLEKLELGCHVTFNSDQLVEMLKCHTNLKELRLNRFASSHHISVGAFEWICDNISELKVLQVNVKSPLQKIPSMLRKLKNLRDFSTAEMHFLPDDKFQFKNDSLAKLRISNSWLSNEEFNQIVRSIARTFTNLTVLHIPVEDFSELSAVLSQCTTLIDLTTTIKNPIAYQLGEKRFPNIRHFTIKDYWGNDIGISVMLSIFQAMPNLKSLWMPCSKLKFNINEFKELIHASKSLEELKVDRFVLDHDWCVTDDFVETFRRLSDQLKAYRLRFELHERLNLNPINDILLNEFNVLDYNEIVNRVSFVLFKGILSKFRGYP